MIILRKQRYRELPWTKENIDKYKNPRNMLKHARFIPEKTVGKFLVAPTDEKLVGYIACEKEILLLLGK